MAARRMRAAGGRCRHPDRATDHIELVINLEHEELCGFTFGRLRVRRLDGAEHLAYRAGAEAADDEHLACKAGAETADDERLACKVGVEWCLHARVVQPPRAVNWLQLTQETLS